MNCAPKERKPHDISHALSRGAVKGAIRRFQADSNSYEYLVALFEANTNSGQRYSKRIRIALSAIRSEANIAKKHRIFEYIMAIIQIVPLFESHPCMMHGPRFQRSARLNLDICISSLMAVRATPTYFFGSTLPC